MTDNATPMPGAAGEKYYIAADEDVGQPGECLNCGDDSPNVDEATELCEMCFEHIMGVEITDEPPATAGGRNG